MLEKPTNRKGLWKKDVLLSEKEREREREIPTSQTKLNPWLLLKITESLSARIRD